MSRHLVRGNLSYVTPLVKTSANTLGSVDKVKIEWNFCSKPDKHTLDNQNFSVWTKNSHCPSQRYNMSDDRNLPLWGGGGGACDDAFGADATTAALKLEYMGCMSRPALFPLDPAHWSRGTGLRPLIGMDLPKKVKSMLDMSWISYSVVTTVFFAYCLRFQNLRISFPNWCIFSAAPDNFETIPKNRKNNIFLEVDNIIP